MASWCGAFSCDDDFYLVWPLLQSVIEMERGAHFEKREKRADWKSLFGIGDDIFVCPYSDDGRTQF